MRVDTFDFTLTFALSKHNNNLEDFLDGLFNAGCDDALVGTGMPGSIALNFSRTARSAEHAIRQGISDVQKAFPDADLLELKPDLVGISDIAELLGCSRQNIRKLAMGGKSNFPCPSVSGSVPLWHFYEVADWMSNNSRVQIKPRAPDLEVAKIAYEKNLEIQRSRYQILVNRSTQTS